MGINGLLPLLKSITRRVHVGQYAGQRVAVDAYCWLHKGAFCCAQELCEGRHTDRFVNFFMSRVDLLRGCGAIPVVVFDGGGLPLKRDEEASRRRSRQEYRLKAEAHVKAGNITAAVECYQRGVDVTPKMAKQVIEVLKAEGVEYIVAPYEADAQMAYLATTGDVYAVVTEDSDMLAYGCQRVLFKMDKMGEGQQILLSDLSLNRPVSFVGFTQQMFLEMCIFAGCDFLKTPNGIGIKKAHQQIRRVKNFARVCKSLRLNGTSIPRTFEAEFQRVIWVFHHQRVFCKRRQAIVHINPLPEGGLLASNVLVPDALPEGDSQQALDFLGPDVDAKLAQAVAVGDLDPFTLEPFDLSQPSAGNQSIDGTQVKCSNQSTSQASSGRGASGRKRRSGSSRPLPVGAPGITNYFSAMPSSCKQAKRQFVAPRLATTVHRPARESNKPGTPQRCSAGDEETTDCLPAVSQKEAKDGHPLRFQSFACSGDFASREGSMVRASHGRNFNRSRPPIPDSTAYHMTADPSQTCDVQSASVAVSQEKLVGDKQLAAGSQAGVDMGMSSSGNGGQHWLSNGSSRVGDSLCSASPVRDCNVALPGSFLAVGRRSPLGTGRALRGLQNSDAFGSAIHGFDDDDINAWDAGTPRRAKFYGRSDASPDILLDELFPNPGSVHFCQGGIPSTGGPSSRKKRCCAELDRHVGADGIGDINCTTFVSPSSKRLNGLLDGLASPDGPLSPLKCNSELPLRRTRQPQELGFGRSALSDPARLKDQKCSNSGNSKLFDLDISADQTCASPVPCAPRNGCDDEQLENSLKDEAVPREEDCRDPTFYSIHHVRGYARVAQRALDYLERGRVQKNQTGETAASMPGRLDCAASKDAGLWATGGYRTRKNWHTGRKATVHGTYGAAVRSNSARNRLFERFACKH